MTARVARRGVESKERLGRHRWVVERTRAWFAGFGKLRIRFERRLDIHVALLLVRKLHTNGVIKEGEDIEADKETIKVSTYKD
ncbi:IS5 family transposase [Paraburkholderia bannensis]|uniref:IS5 family transposase n=1 Tax=Paraburkholderia bannensis TaxID=765414 RepID=A0A7W9U291_9BURK|nr:IS5 family transposase [Paraburkholderia sp. WP4_3_2]MBB6105706.1 IS5 family transposase [Paraburkholderia bannensis]